MLFFVFCHFKRSLFSLIWNRWQLVQFLWACLSLTVCKGAIPHILSFLKENFVCDSLKYFSGIFMWNKFSYGEVQESLPKFRSLFLCSVNKRDTCFGDFKAVFLSPTLVYILHSASLSGSASLCSRGALPWKQAQRVTRARFPQAPFLVFLIVGSLHSPSMRQYKPTPPVSSPKKICKWPVSIWKDA